MERKTITIKEFEAKYGFQWEDILRLGWLEDVSEDGKPFYRCVEWNDCPSYSFFFDRKWMRMPEVYEDTAPVLAEIIKRSKEAEERFHCFSWDGNCVICLSDGESLRVKRFYLDVYKKQYNESK